MEELICLVVCTRDTHNELVAVECETLTGKRPVNGVAMGGRIERVPHAAYLRAGVQVLAHGETLEDLVGQIRKLKLAVDGFRIELLTLAERMPVQRQEAIVTLADALVCCRPDLDHPRYRLLLIVQEAGLAFGEILVEPDYSYRQHDNKPYRTSSSLPARLARGLVNLVLPDAQTVLDPCCGTGSILLEAQAMGLRAMGGDWNPKMVNMSRRNLAHFGYGVEVELRDARHWPAPADAIVTDLPYGKNLEVSEEVTLGILAQARELAPVAVFVAGRDLSSRLREVGYARVEVFQVPKYTGFVRYVHRAWRAAQ